MSMSLGTAAALALLTGCPRATTPTASTPERPPLPPIDCASDASVSLHLVLPPGSEAGRAELIADIGRARASVERFAIAHGWQALYRSCPFADIEVVATAADLSARATALGGPPPSPGMPARIAGGVLLVLAPEAYRKEHPSFAATDDWMRLVATALARELHGDVLANAGLPRTATGPDWFADGFAGLGGGQDLDRLVPPLTVAPPAPDGLTAALAAAVPAEDLGDPLVPALRTASARAWARGVALPALVVAAASAAPP